MRPVHGHAESTDWQQTSAACTYSSGGMQSAANLATAMHSFFVTNLLQLMLQYLSNQWLEPKLYTS